jgi:hypothetical protein
VTLGSSLFSSSARVKVAHDNGLDRTSEEYHLAAGKHAGIASLAMMRKLGIKYIAATMAGAARSNKLAEVQFLHAQGCPWSMYLLEDAARDGYFELLRWCYEQDCGWERGAAVAPAYAAESGNIELLAWGCSNQAHSCPQG